MKILYRDETLLAVEKPPGLPVHRGERDPAGLATALKEARRLAGGHVYPVHRLDRATSGLLLFALSPDAARAVAGAFAAGEVKKKYLAVVRGIIAAEGVIDHPLAEEPDRNNRHVAGPLRQAVTAFRRLAEVELPLATGRYPTSRYSLVAAEPLTGRRHQLRRHFKHLFHPIIGDTTYGEGRHNRLFREHFACSRLLLAAVALTIPHPATNAPLTITAPPDQEFLRVVRELGWHGALTGLRDGTGKDPHVP